MQLVGAITAGEVVRTLGLLGSNALMERSAVIVSVTEMQVEGLDAL
jgi:hypothetical protein